MKKIVFFTSLAVLIVMCCVIQGVAADQFESPLYDVRVAQASTGLNNVVNVNDELVSSDAKLINNSDVEVLNPVTFDLNCVKDIKTIKQPECLIPITVRPVDCIRTIRQPECFIRTIKLSECPINTLRCPIETIKCPVQTLACPIETMACPIFEGPGDILKGTDILTQIQIR